MRAPLPLTTTVLPDEMPEQYVMKCDGRCLEPEIRNGQRLLFSRTERYKTGDFVVLYLKPELVPKGNHQLLVKKLIISPPPAFWRDWKVNPSAGIRPVVIVEMLNPQKIMYFDPSHLLGVHKCIGPVPAGLKTYRVTDQELKAKAKRQLAS
jgi:hypothetical protein